MERAGKIEEQQSNVPAPAYPGRWWHAIADERIQCDLCPRDCKLHEGQRGACFVRQNLGGQMVLTTYGRSSGFCIDPIEKKPLNHFHPGSAILSFGTAGCNLACKFCQNWDISKSKDMDRLLDVASPDRIAASAVAYGASRWLSPTTTR
jgi:pyruvate formate lyase activating enzyme